MAARQRGSDKFTLDGTGQSDANDLDGNGKHANGNPDDSGPIDPASLAGGTPTDSGTGEPAKGKRGRPKGSTNKTKSETPLDIGTVETVLFNIHSMVAAATGFDKLAINQTEANTLAKAVATVQNHYPMHVSAKALAWTNLFMVAGSVYGSRVVAIWADQKAAENDKPMPWQPQQPNSASITPIRP